MLGLKALLWIGIIIASTARADRLLELRSVTDGQGTFTYTLRSLHERYIPGFHSYDNSGIHIRSFGVTEVLPPAGWTYTVDSNIVFFRTTQSVYYVEQPVSFTIKSCITATTNYVGIPFSDRYMRAILYMTIYSTPQHEPLGYGPDPHEVLGPLPPSLTIEQKGGTVYVRWPISAVGFELESKDFRDDSQWQPVRVTPEVRDSYFVVALPRAPALPFYRLASPCFQTRPQGQD